MPKGEFQYLTDKKLKEIRTMCKADKVNTNDPAKKSYIDMIITHIDLLLGKKK